MQGHDENGLSRSLNGGLTGVHEVLCSAVEIARRGHQDFDLGFDGGFMILVHSKNGKATGTHIERLVSWRVRQKLIFVYIKDNIFNYFLSKEVKSTENNTVNNFQLWRNEYGRVASS